MEYNHHFTVDNCHSDMIEDIKGLIGEYAPRIYTEIANKCYLMGYARGIQSFSDE